MVETPRMYTNNVNAPPSDNYHHRLIPAGEDLRCSWLEKPKRKTLPQLNPPLIQLTPLPASLGIRPKQPQLRVEVVAV